MKIDEEIFREMTEDIEVKKFEDFKNEIMKEIKKIDNG